MKEKHRVILYLTNTFMLAFVTVILSRDYTYNSYWGLTGVLTIIYMVIPFIQADKLKLKTNRSDKKIQILQQLSYEIDNYINLYRPKEGEK